MGLIYLINECGTDNYKIGITRAKSETHRKKTLQTGNSNKLETIYTFQTDYPYRIESMLHFHYKFKKCHGEWFTLTSEEVKNFPSLCQEFADLLTLLMRENYFFQNMKIK